MFSAELTAPLEPGLRLQRRRSNMNGLARATGAGGLGSLRVRAFVFIAAALALGLMTSGCDRCGDPVKFNFPSVNACSDDK